jgi:hypothetical protein
MPARLRQLAVMVVLLVEGLSRGVAVRGQEIRGQPPAQPAAATLSPVSHGVQVLARGPIHEAFAAPTTDPVPTKPISKAPPKPLEELPPAEKPEGDAIWVNGYWAWDEERNDFLWVSGIWRIPPPGRRWVTGYWRPENEQWHWVPGFWAPGGTQEGLPLTLTYLPSPPAPRETVQLGLPPTRESFSVPGYWIWQEAHYRTTNGARVWQGTGFVWRAGYWAQRQPGYIWIPDHYRWTPGGCIAVAGYWDLPFADRGVLYAPVQVDRAAIGKNFVFTPAYAVHDALVLDTLFVRPNYGHYYFGDYYSPMYRELGFASVFEYGQHRYDALLDSERFAHRSDPRWEATQLAICLARHAGRAPCPPRTPVQDNHSAGPNSPIAQNLKTVHSSPNGSRTAGYPFPLLIPAAELAATKNLRMVSLDKAARTQAKQQAQALQQVGLQRVQIEVKPAVDALIRPRTTMVNLPLLQPLATHPAPAPEAHAPATVSEATPVRPTVGPLAGNPAGATSTAARPAAPALPSQPVPEGKPSSSARAIVPATGMRFQRVPQPTSPSSPSSPFQRLIPIQPPQPTARPEPPKAEAGDRTP